MSKHEKISLKQEAERLGDGLLLHVCCAPCSGAVIEALVRDGLRPVVFFSNSNICPKEEYDLRLGECRRYCEHYALELVEDDYDHNAWLQIAKGREADPERAERCMQCFRFRLLRAAKFASGRGLGVLATSLASSRWKDLEQVDSAGQFACSMFPGVRWWGKNWRKGSLQQRRGEIICEQNFYNQTFCGCEFSRRQNMDKHISYDTL